MKDNIVLLYFFQIDQNVDNSFSSPHQNNEYAFFFFNLMRIN